MVVYELKLNHNINHRENITFLQGVKVSTTIERLRAGFYIVRQGTTEKKVAVK